MSHACHICNHARRLEIDRLIVEGKNLAKLSKEFDVPYHSIYQHSQKHITRQLATVMGNKQLAIGEELLQTINEIITTAKVILKRNFEKKDKDHDLVALKAVDSVRNTIQLLSNISSQLHSARMAELQLEKDQSGETEQQLKEQQQAALRILSNEELPVYLRLVNKVLNQNSDKIISNGKVLKPNYNMNKEYGE
jgi:hypothetical protein